ncbi:MAG TPA: 1-deoxy-D-xylulose-5-phosphate reductoisomerase [Candidatus Sumerlaeota bacterium]|nr:1-deoxy-D-xylulose-5-phosphate reductoisomerase [Candidatus Sumerlaeota bacterium]
MSPPSSFPPPRRVLLLGSTGSIGLSTLDVIRDFPDRFEVVGLSAHRNVDLLIRQIEVFKPAWVCVTDETAAQRGGERVRAALERHGGKFLSGPDGLTGLVEQCPDVDLVVVATVGFAGLAPTLTAIERGIRIALANKEVLVAGGTLVMGRARTAGVDILPIDSEHNAIFQCLQGQDRRAVRRLLLTASGGPLRNKSPEEVARTSVEEALQHPTWKMGAKITIDSATLMNKGLEVIEACHLFDVSPDRVEVVVHPQSVLHSMVEFTDGSILAQLGQTDMYLPILNVLSYPERLPNRFEPLDLARVGALTFSKPDGHTFPCLRYAYEAIATGGTAPAVLSAANEVAVEAFLNRRIGFPAIADTVRRVLDRYNTERGFGSADGLDLTLLREADGRAREMARAYAGYSL